MTSIRIIASCLFVLLVSSTSDAFSVGSPSQHGVSRQTSSTQLNIFGDALKGAFSNDESLGKVQNAGLKNVSRK